MLNMIVAVVLGTSAFSAETVLKFPKGFHWCVATSAHQIEGYNSNSDWWDFELEKGRIKHGDRSGAAADHWNRLEEDTRLLRELNVSQYRFSVEWAKIEPRSGEFDLSVIEHYRRELALLKEAGVRPMITLHHFTHPRWFAAQGAWEHKDAPAQFARYARFVAEQLGDGVVEWVTINEPMVHLVNGYMNGVFAPGRKGEMKTLLAPMLGLLRAHAAAYAEVKKARPEAQIGMAHHLRVFDPPHALALLDSFLAGKFDHAFNWALAESLETGRLNFDIPFAVSVDQKIAGLKGTQDFIGVNYYGRDIVRLKLGGAGFSLSVPKNADVTDLGWEIYPRGFYRILKTVGKKFKGKPVFITENGLADSRDAKRPRFLESHLAELHLAIAEGVPVKGYCHWSLLDNFEWAEGFEPRFGLYEVDYRTFERRPRPSAQLFARIAGENAVRVSVPPRKGR